MTLQVINPTTEEVLAEFDRATPGDVDRAVEAAHHAQREWWGWGPERRAAVLHAVADGLEAAREELAVLDSQNVGMPIVDTRGTAANAAATFRYYAASPQRLTGKTFPVDGGVDMTFQEPFGVVGLITPWNFPLPIASWKIAPALAAGNAVIVKPAELTPLSTLRLRDIAIAAGLPRDLVQVVIGRGSDVGEHLVRHPGVGKISFTGSTEVGRRIASTAGEQIKRVSLELGGKSAAIIFEDADLKLAAQGLVGGAFGNSGQDCCARSRVFVQRGVSGEFLKHVRTVVDGIRVGNPLNETTVMGPLVSSAHRDSVQEYVDQAEVFHQGHVPDGPGFWFAPTVLYPAGQADVCSREEIFGPVISVMLFDDEDEAIQRVNDTPYGLSGSIWTANGARALRVARGVDSGALAINSYSSVRVSTPFGGFKQSGIGRELGPDSVYAYSETKNVFMSTTR